VTHDLTLARRAQRLIRLADGIVVEDTGMGHGALGMEDSSGASVAAAGNA
jgi:hypothetical protein